MTTSIERQMTLYINFHIDDPLESDSLDVPMT